jgi:hypothetical protein
MAEYGSFKRDREDLNRQIAEEKDPGRRKTFELRRDIEAADYMSITSRRLASQSEIIVGRSNTDEAIRQREQAARFEAEAKELRRQYREQTAEREQADEPETARTPEHARGDRAPRQRGPRTSRGRSAREEQTAEARERQAEAGDAERGGEERRAQRGERVADETGHRQDRGPDLER